MLETRHIVLLVEDNEDDEDLTLRAIENCGVPCTVDVIRHGGEVVGRILGPNGSMPELVILDYHLPGLNGVEVLRELRRSPLTKRLPIVVLSGLGSDRELTECLEEGANSCVQKPMDEKRYLDHVGQLVRYWLTVDRRPEFSIPTG